MPRFVWFVLVALVCLLAPPAVGAEASNRVFLMAGPNDTWIWSTDLTDPAAQEAQASWGCKAGPNGVSTVPCTTMQSGATAYHVPFAQGAALEAPVTWTPSTAPTFHFELDILLTQGTASVSMYMTNANKTWESLPATEVSPGVFEGRLSVAGSLDPSAPTSIRTVVRVNGHFRGYSVKTRGASYVDFGTPLQAKAFPQLISESTYAPQPTVFSSMDHWFTFNDANWTVIPFEGNTSTLKRIPFSLSHKAAAVYAYLDDWSSPLVHRTVRRQQPDGRTLLTNPILTIFKDDVEEARGPRSVATAALPAGDYVLQIERPPLENGTVQSDIPYQGYLLLVHGERTLASMRTQFPPSVVAQWMTPVTHNGPPQTESLVVPEQATTMAFDLSVDAVDPIPRQWYVYYSIYGYAGGGARDGARTVVGGAGAGRFTAAPTTDQLVLSSQDMMFDLTLSYTYTPPPVP
jgi:hypothetical protein